MSELQDRIVTLTGKISSVDTVAWDAASRRVELIEFVQQDYLDGLSIAFQREDEAEYNRWLANATAVRSVLPADQAALYDGSQFVQGAVGGTGDPYAEAGGLLGIWGGALGSVGQDLRYAVTGEGGPGEGALATAIRNQQAGEGVGTGPKIMMVALGIAGVLLIWKLMR